MSSSPNHMDLPVDVLGVHVFPFHAAPGDLMLLRKGVAPYARQPHVLLAWARMHAASDPSRAAAMAHHLCQRADQLDDAQSAELVRVMAAVAHEPETTGVFDELVGVAVPDRPITIDALLKLALKQSELRVLQDAARLDRADIVAQVVHAAEARNGHNAWLHVQEAMVTAVEHGSVDVARYLLHRYSDPEAAPDSFSVRVDPSARIEEDDYESCIITFTPLLHVAIERGHDACANLLMDRGCDLPDLTSAYDYTYLERDVDEFDEDELAEEASVSESHDATLVVAAGSAACSIGLLRRVAQATVNERDVLEALQVLAAGGRKDAFDAVVRHHGVPGADWAHALLVRDPDACARHPGILCEVLRNLPAAEGGGEAKEVRPTADLTRAVVAGETWMLERLLSVCCDGDLCDVVGRAIAAACCDGDQPRLRAAVAAAIRYAGSHRIRDVLARAVQHNKTHHAIIADALRPYGPDAVGALLEVSMHTIDDATVREVLQANDVHLTPAHLHLALHHGRPALMGVLLDHREWSREELAMGLLPADRREGSPAHVACAMSLVDAFSRKRRPDDSVVYSPSDWSRDTMR